MKAKLIVEGREFPIEIQDPELQKLLTDTKNTGYERVGDGHTYSFVNSWDDVQTVDDEYVNDDLRYCTANYYSDRTVAENNARADRLMRQLRRFAVEHREKELRWKIQGKQKYCLYYNYTHDDIDVGYSSLAEFLGCTYFDSKEAAELAIETFHDELIWYFTEYKDSL